MRRLLPLVIPPWALPFLVLVLIAPSVAAFALAGPQLGLAVGALTVAALVVVAARTRFDEPIEIAAGRDGRYGVLVVTSEPLEDPRAIEAIAEFASEGGVAVHGAAPAEPRVLVVAPAVSSTLDTWASDVRAARVGAERALAITLGTLAAAGLDVAGRIGDASPVQAVEDELRSFAAHEVVMVRGPSVGAGEIEEVRRRLDRPVRELSQAGS